MNKQDIVLEQLTLIQVYYYMPDYPSVINEFTWQTIDLYPRFPRMRRFLDYWSCNIDAKINEIYLNYADPVYGPNYFKNVTHIWHKVN
jgi:uncharacterized protein Usg